MLIKVENREQFESIVFDAQNKDKIIVANFGATWCGPCRMMLPGYEKLAEKYSLNFVFTKLDIDKVDDLAEMYKISTVPTIIFLDYGSLESKYSTHVGSDVNALENKLKTMTLSTPLSDDF